jgi:hypothetical protein
MKPSQAGVKKIFIGGIYGVDETILRQYFEGFGKITEIQIIRHRDGLVYKFYSK